ncbi:MAG: hypothetical protein JW850_16780 [Thermoflexales bacterium]|nr:hypothetical protein [Thermoflexales bacterium]
MLIECSNCGWKGKLSLELLTAAVGAAAQKKAEYHVEHCPQCQWVIHVAVAKMQAMLEPQEAASRRAGKKKAKSKSRPPK